jgi:transposase, IS30 family
MPRYAPNTMPPDVKRRYLELIRTGLCDARAAADVGVSLSCGSVWFIDAGSVSFVEKSIAARIGKCYQSVYREIVRNRKPGGRYQPWSAHNQAHLRRGADPTRDGWPAAPGCAKQSR